MLLYPYRYNKLLRYYTPIDTTIYYATILLLIQQSPMTLYYYWYKILRYYPYWYSNLIRHYPLIDTASYYMNILPWIQQANTFVPYSYWYHNQLRYYIPIGTASSNATILILIQQSNLALYPYWHSNLLYHHTTTDTTLLRYDTQLDTTSYYAISYVTIFLWYSKIYDTISPLIQLIMLLLFYWYSTLLS